MNLQGQQGLLDTWRNSWQSRGSSAMAISFLLLVSYLALFFGGTDRFGVAWPDPFGGGARWLAPQLGLAALDKWFLYGGIYSLLMIVGGLRYLRRHGNSRYNQVRIATNVGVQVVLALMLPYVMQVMLGRQFYLSYLWPLKIEYFYPSVILQHPFLIVLYSVVGSLLLFPLLAWRFGKRWYCSWVCGCGGLANTFGDPWRHLTSSSPGSWRFERKAVHGTLLIAVVTTALVVANWAVGEQYPRLSQGAFYVQDAYGFVVGAMLAGVIGTGVYPLLGPRVWCRNFCPMAAILGLVQLVGRFRIRVKPGMCISCGNCTAYCEMGIDVRAYAEADQSFVRASCVGCGMCAHVCPRGVLRLENAPGGEDRYSVRLDV